jgi:hypothetical protein
MQKIFLEATEYIYLPFVWQSRQWLWLYMV